MNEKFSEITTRQNKINLLKSKIRDEIKEDDINIWLQEDYNFVHRLFFLVENRLGMLDFILTDKFLGMELISAYERVLYSKRIETRLI